MRSPGRQASVTTPTTAIPSVPPAMDPAATITYALDQEPDNFNVLTSAGNGFDGEQIMDRLWPSVFHADPDATFALDTAFMRSAVETSANPQVVVYSINPQAVWQDGVPINADDFVYNWQAQSGLPRFTDVGGKPFDAASNTGYSQIASVTSSPDGFTVTTTYASPFPDWRSLFQNLAPAHIMRSIGWNTGLLAGNVKAATLISGGPFAFSSYTPGRDFIVKRNPRYWGAPAGLAQVDYRFIPDSTAAELALANGEVQAFYPQPQLDLIDQVRKLPGVTLDERPGLAFEHLDFNQANPWLSDLAVRQAIALSIDREQLIRRTVGQFAGGIVPDNNHIYVPSQPQYRDNAMGSLPSPPGPGGSYGAADVGAAKALLVAHGYSFAPQPCCPGATQTLTRQGRAVTLRITSTQGNALRASEEQFVAAALAKIGISVVEADTSDLTGTLTSGNFDLALFSWVQTPVASGDDPIYQTATHSTGADNFDHFSLPQVDALIAQADVATTPAAEATLYNQVDALLWKGMVSLPLFQEPTVLVYQSQYRNLHNNITSEGPVYNEEQWGVPATR